MARRVKEYTVTTNNRDKGKLFRITEMSAADAEWWAARGFMALAKAGVDVGDMSDAGLQGLAVLGIQSLFKLPPAEIKPLLDEMWKCVKIVTDPSNPTIDRVLQDDDIEEVQTRVMLRAEVISLHIDFSITGAVSSLQTSGTLSQGSKIIPPSPARSGRLSQPNKRR